jgi:mitotic spindle assembly checkpoint protein MAD2B
MTPPQLAQYFRSFLIRLGLLDGYLGVIPPEYEPTFAIVLEMKDGAQPTEPTGKVGNGSV